MIGTCFRLEKIDDETEGERWKLLREKKKFEKAGWGRNGEE